MREGTIVRALLSIALLFSIVALGTGTAARASITPRGFSYGFAGVGQDAPDASAAVAYCKSSGGVYELRKPEFGTNSSSKAPLILSGSAGFCRYASKQGSNTTYIFITVSTLYATLPTLAVLAYQAKVKANCTGGGNPASCYCSELGGTDLFGGINASGGGWVNTGDKAIPTLDACIFPDLSSIDAFGLFYHSAGIIRGINLDKVVRYVKPKG
jgi:putative hemolysin